MKKKWAKPTVSGYSGTVMVMGMIMSAKDAATMFRHMIKDPYLRWTGRKRILLRNAIDPAPDTSCGTLGGNTSGRRIQRDEGM